MQTNKMTKMKDQELTNNEAELLECFRNCDDQAKRLLIRLAKYQHELQKKKDSEQ
jgi:hypothetical protein